MGKIGFSFEGKSDLNWEKGTSGLGNEQWRENDWGCAKEKKEKLLNCSTLVQVSFFDGGAWYFF